MRRKRNEQIIELLKQGLIHKNIAERYGISRAWVSKIAKKEAIFRIKRERNPVQNEKIIEAFKFGLSPKEIAAKLCITETWVYILVKRKGVKKVSKNSIFYLNFLRLKNKKFEYKLMHYNPKGVRG